LRGDLARARYLHQVDLSVPAQEAYLDRYFDRPGDYYFVVENRATLGGEGLIGVYDISSGPPSTAEWGRWIIRPGSLAAVESALLILRVAFDVFGLDEVYSRTILENTGVVSFHDSCNLPRRRIIPGHVRIGDITYNCVEHVASRATWPTLSERLTTRARQIGRRLLETS
jgi:RimJ/RimL family protein N-acetyltransferase